jgi:flagellar protein FliS
MMQASMVRAAQAYRQTEVQSRSPLELVVMLYDGALRFMNGAREAIVKNDPVAKRTEISRALEIVSELQSTLNMREGGEVARSLDILYSWVHRRLVEANMHNDPEAIDESRRVLMPLREAWMELAATGHVPAPQARP